MPYKVAAAIRNALRLSTLPVREAARRSGVHYVTIHHWASKTHTPKIVEAEAVLAAMGYGLRVVDLSTDPPRIITDMDL